MVIEVLLPSGFALLVLCFTRTWASIFFLSQSLKSRRYGPTQCFLNGKSDHDSFLFRGNFCIAWLGREAPFKSAIFDSNLKALSRLVIVVEKLMALSLLCIFRGGQLLSLSKCALTTACGWTNYVLKLLVYPCTFNHSKQTFVIFALPSLLSDCESIALLNWSYHSCHCNVSRKQRAIYKPIFLPPTGQSVWHMSGKDNAGRGQIGKKLK